MGDDLMTIDEAREVVRSYRPKSSDLHRAEIVLLLSDYFGDQMIAYEIRKARFLENLK